jgi:hypothetical protein
VNKAVEISLVVVVVIAATFWFIDKDVQSEEIKEDLWFENYEESCLGWDGPVEYLKADALGACKALRHWQDQ